MIAGRPYEWLEVRRAKDAGCATIYAGTGENAIRRDTYHGAGLLIGSRSQGHPSGMTWRQRTGGPAFDFRHGSINNIVLDPTTSGASKRIFITLSSGVTVSASEATVTAPEPRGGYGIYRSDEQGATWTKLTVMGAEGAKPTDLKPDPARPTALFAGFLGRGIFKSTNSGATWCPLNSDIPVPPGCPNATGLPGVKM